MIVLWDINVTKRQNNGSLNAQSACDWSLEKYYEVARQCIGKFNVGSMARQMLQNEDAISFIAEHLMYATHRWEKYPDGRAFKSYLNQCSIWGMYRWAHMLKSPGLTKHTTISLNESCSYDDNKPQRYAICVDDTIPPPDIIIQKQEKTKTIYNMLHSDGVGLTLRQLQCIEGVYIHGQSKAQVARTLGVSRKRVGQCVVRGIQKIKMALNTDDKAIQEIL
jgi:DNA-directed RNA polymerase specialized sigma24 family protein